MSENIKRCPKTPEWIKNKSLKKEFLESLKEIFAFFVITTPYESYSARSIEVSEYGWGENAFASGDLKELFHLANLTNDTSLLVAYSLDELAEKCKTPGFDENFYKSRDKERIVVYVASNSNILLSIFKNIRNALAHGRFEMYSSGEDFIYVLESAEKSGDVYEVRSRMVLRQSTLLKWIKVIKRGPIQKAPKRQLKSKLVKQ